MFKFTVVERWFLSALQLRSSITTLPSKGQTKSLSYSPFIRTTLPVCRVYSTPLLSKTTHPQDPHTANVCDFTLTHLKHSDHGYKLCIKVYANGYGVGKDTHISIFVSLMRGDYDNGLQWPFEGDIVVELLNWRDDCRHNRGGTIDLNKLNNPDGSITSRVTEGEYARSARGAKSFISHSSLLYNPDTNTEYLQDDCLRLRVVDIAVYSTHLLSKTPSWQEPHTATQSVCDFTLTEFTKHKQFNNIYYSPPFCSHPHGYKLCLRVEANGYDDDGKNHHISIYAILMRGDYDNGLQWPFEGDIVVELLNWRDDCHHYRGGTIGLNKLNDPDGSITSRVTIGRICTQCTGRQIFHLPLLSSLQS